MHRRTNEYTAGRISHTGFVKSHGHPTEHKQVLVIRARQISAPERNLTYQTSTRNDVNSARADCGYVRSADVVRRPPEVADDRRRRVHQSHDSRLRQLMTGVDENKMTEVYYNHAGHASRSSRRRRVILQ
jgi:hypothetical protein